MKLKNLTPELRLEIQSAISALQKASRRATKHNAYALKLSAEMEALEDEHAALSGKQTLTRTEAGSETAIIAQKKRLAVAIEQAEAGAETDRLTVYRTVSAVSALLNRLCTLAVEQVIAEVEALLAPFFSPGASSIRSVSTQTELQQNLIAVFRQPNGMPPNTLAAALKNAQAAQKLLEDIAADGDFFSLTPHAQPREVAKAG